MTLHLHSLIKSSCCVKLSFVSPSTFFFVTMLFILELHFLLTSKTLPHKPKMYFQDKEVTPTHLTKAYKSLSHGTKNTSGFDQVLSINWQMNAMLLTQVPCPVTPTFYPGSKLLALLDHTFAEYLFLCKDTIVWNSPNPSGL